MLPAGMLDFVFLAIANGINGEIKNILLAGLHKAYSTI
jgi:hypothetical protein